MLTRLSEALRKYAKGWNVLIFLALDVFFNAVILPAQQASIKTGPIDLLFFYTPQKVYSMIAAYGEAGRASYRLFELTDDIIYPIVYTLCFSLLITWLFKKGFPADHKIQQFNVMPFGAWLFDLLENLGIVSMLSVFPATPAALAWLTTVFTMIKWTFAGLSILLMLIGIVATLSDLFKKK